MKSENLTFGDAIKAFVEGRCDGISQWKTFYVKFNKYGELQWVPMEQGFETPDDGLHLFNYAATDWRLINPRPKTEPVEEKRWRWDTGKISDIGNEPDESCQDMGQWITVRYEREVPEPKTKEFESDVELYGSMAIILAPADYIGKRVRCIVED